MTFEIWRDGDPDNFEMRISEYCGAINVEPVSASICCGPDGIYTLAIVFRPLDVDDYEPEFEEE